jgi:hypothetical protein
MRPLLLFVPEMTPELTIAIENAYREFQRYRLRGVIAVCKCNVCVSDADEKALCTVPLRQISSRLLTEYTQSAHGCDDRAADELRYFLPRYFELIAQDDAPTNTGIETCLGRLHDAQYRTRWPASEVGAIDAFFAALLRAQLAEPPEIDPTGFPVFDPDTADDVLCMVAYAGGDVRPCLSVWDGEDSRAATLHIANIVAKADWFRRRLDNGFWYGNYKRDTESAMRQVIAWLLREETRARLEAACLAEGDEAAAALLSHAEGLVAGLIAADQSGR